MTTTKTRDQESSTSKHPSIGEFVLAWMRDKLVHAEGDLYGKRFEPPAWLCEAVNQTYRFDRHTFRRLVDRVVVGLPKGCAKTEGAAAWALAELAGPVVAHPGVLEGEWPLLRQSPNVPVGAASYEQARLCFGAAAVMVKEGELDPWCEVFENRIQLVDRPGRLYRIAAEAGTQDGSLPTAFVADEVHEWTGRKRRVHTVVGNSLRKRASGLEINISTAGDPDTSDLLFELYEYGRKVNSGEIDDPSFLFIWQAASDGFDLSDPDELLAATTEAYRLAPWIDPERIAGRYSQIPSHEFERYHLNRWVTAGRSWLPPGVWDGLTAAGRDVPDGTPIVMGFDGSYSGDSTALWGCTLDGHLFKVGVWERPPNAKDWRVPRNEVDARVDEAFQTWDVLELACDPSRWTLFLDEWVDRYGDDRVLEYPQARPKMAPATAKFYDAAVNELLTHDGDASLARHVANATIKEFPGGYVLQKDHPDRKIDAAIAAVIAYDRATWRRDESTVDVQVMIV